MKVLVTGFAPFGKDTLNPSFEAVRLLPDRIGEATIIKKEIPVVFHKGANLVEQCIRQEQPELVLLVGQAGGRTCITPERVAINVQDCSPNFPDNEGNLPQGEPIVADGPAAYFATVPIKAMVAKMLENGVPAAISNTAGTYVCNDLMYQLLHLLQREFPQTRGGFIHVPYATIQNHPNAPSMTLEQMASGLRLSIEACLEQEKDISTATGATH